MAKSPARGLERAGHYKIHAARCARIQAARCARTTPQLGGAFVIVISDSISKFFGVIKAIGDEAILNGCGFRVLVFPVFVFLSRGICCRWAAEKASSDGRQAFASAADA